ncbi:MAG: hypothetical protein AB7P01_13835 [Bacteroidia bacterium]
MTLPYRFFINPFLSVTRNSYKDMLSLGVDHKAKLVANQADPEIAAILVTYDPILQSYLNVDQNLSSVLGTYKGKTQTVEELFVELAKVRLPIWEGQIFFFFPEGTETATTLFPNARSAFNDGTYEQRIQAIKVLGDKCALIPSLAGVSANILAFHTQIESARLTQQSQGEGAADTLRTLRETARVLLCQELYGDMGKLMYKFRSNPTAIGDYFDMEILRSAGADWEEFDINANEILNLLEDVEAGDLNGIKFKNTSPASSGMVLYIYTTNTINGGWTGAGITLNPGEEKTIDENDFGALQSFFNVQNQSGNAGTFETKGL